MRSCYAGCACVAASQYDPWVIVIVVTTTHTRLTAMIRLRGLPHRTHPTALYGHAVSAHSSRLVSIRYTVKTLLIMVRYDAKIFHLYSAKGLSDQRERTMMRASQNGFLLQP